MRQEADYILLLDFFARLVDSTKGTVLDSQTKFLADTQPLAAKFLLHCGSIYHLMKGTRIPGILGKELSYLDNHSIIVLVRTIHELHLAFNFIFVSSATIEVNAFRHKVWELGAFLDRQKFPATEEENIKKLQSEKEVVSQLTGAITSSSVYQALTPPQQDKSLRGEWRLGYAWVDLAEFAGLDKEQFRSTYRYLCSYAHTGHLSIFQMQQAADFSELYSLTETWIDSTMGVISHFIYDYVKIYPKASELFKQFPKAEQIAYINDGLGRKATEMNGGV
jgi:hypothetical protein